MKDDLISRQAAIDAIVKHSYAVRYDYNFTSIENGMTVTGIKQVLGELPSAQPQKVCVAEIKLEIDDIKEYIDKAINAERWTPCSESDKLPKEFESVLVCYNSQGGIAQAVSERITKADGSTLWSALAGIEPIAWMPLPQPYKAAKEEETR